MNYFNSIVQSLTITDLKILGILHDQNIDVKFKAVKKKKLKEESLLSESNFRKSLYRLDAMQFIELVTGEKDHRVFISDIGKEALRISLSEEAI
ncbi:hypothetical protein LCM23_06285 [Cytobacillus kochii]|uniref:hypothetical protein n=1 Tax=Cytobacillus kochii TaxID=859143 RepID=UPI001CD1AD26|nr:hypothetical protein [Cytobacillus kochii]MCA1025693.1 hypothetical protein [Cytobacillus kochii]